MARTKASIGAKVASGKSSKARCSATPASSSAGTSAGGSAERRSHSSGGGNPVCPRETPAWQRRITNFFIGKESATDGASGSSKPAEDVTVPDDEESPRREKPKNSVLDESIELEPLTGEDSHKINEFFPKNAKDTTKTGSLGPRNGTNRLNSKATGAKNIENGCQKETPLDESNGSKDSQNHISNGSKENSLVTSVRNGEVDPKNGEIDPEKGEKDPKGKGKGTGKRTKQKENIDTNADVEKRRSAKRDLEEIAFGEESPQSAKKVKVN